MEEILSSIKRIIADDDRPAPRGARRGSSGGASRAEPLDLGGEDEILELTEALSDEDASREEEDVPQTPAAKPVKAVRAEPKPQRAREATAPGAAPAAPVLSDLSAKAARDSLNNLSKLLIRTDDSQPNTLEGLVREMLRPMLKDWLDANLPQLVETLVKREIDRITGRV